MTQRHLGHIAQILHQILSTVSKGRRQDHKKAEKDRGPRCVIGRQEIIDVNSAARRQEKIDEEHSGEDGEGQGRLVLLQVRVLVHDARGDDLEHGHDRGDAGQDDEDEEEAGPEPVVLEGGEGGFGEGDAHQPESLAGDGHEELGAVVVPQVVDVDPLRLVCHAQEAEHEQNGEEGPHEVADRQNPGVSEIFEVYSLKMFLHNS